MLRVCVLGQHLFDDGIENYSTVNMVAMIKTHEQVACKECWDKFTKDVSEMMKKIKENKDV